MSLEVRLNSEAPGAGPVYVTDLAAINTGELSASYSQCTLSGVGDTCWLNTSGGCANTGTNSAPLPGGCGQDALQISYGPYSGAYWNQGASVQVVSELEIPSDMAEDWEADFWEAEAEALAQAVGMWDGGGDEARGRAPAPRALRAHASRSGG